MNNETEKNRTYDHLTTEQLIILDELLFEVMFEDMQRDPYYLEDCLLDYIERMDVATKLAALSSDEESRRELLGFDPEDCNND